jgi:6,7-dimethyl-8-ribityllumazine synthase
VNILIVEARYHSHIADLLVDGATAALEQGGAHFVRVAVPGVLEVPTAIAMTAQGPAPFDGYVALGCVLGDDEVTATLYRETMRGLTGLGLDGIAIGNAILFAPDEQGALEDAGTGDAGGDAARAALALAGLRGRLEFLR